MVEWSMAGTMVRIILVPGTFKWFQWHVLTATSRHIEGAITLIIAAESLDQRKLGGGRHLKGSIVDRFIGPTTGLLLSPIELNPIEFYIETLLERYPPPFR